MTEPKKGLSDLGNMLDILDKQDSDYLAETASNMTEFLGMDESTTLAAINPLPEDVEAILKDQCLSRVVSQVDLFAPYVFPGFIKNQPNESVKKAAQMLLPVTRKALQMKLSKLGSNSHAVSAEEVSVSLAKLRGAYLIATKLNPVLAADTNYPINRIRLAICTMWALEFDSLVPASMLVTLPGDERQEAKRFFDPTPEENQVLNKILPHFLLSGEIRKCQIAVEQSQQDIKDRCTRLVDSGVHPKIAENKVFVDLAKDVYILKKQDLLELICDEKQLNLLAQAITQKSPL